MVAGNTRPRGSTRDEILDAAEALMADRGYAATSIAAVCATSNFPVGSVYWHFRDKAGLLAAVMERGSQEFFAQLPTAATLEGTPRERFDRWFDANTELLVRRPPFLRLHLTLCLGEHNESPTHDTLERVRTMARGRIADALHPWVDQFHPDNSVEMSRSLAAYMLATVDGAFIAQHADGAWLAGLLQILHASLVSAVQHSH